MKFVFRALVGALVLAMSCGKPRIGRRYLLGKYYSAKGRVALRRVSPLVNVF